MVCPGARTIDEMKRKLEDDNVGGSIRTCMHTEQNFASSLHQQVRRPQTERHARTKLLRVVVLVLNSVL